MSVTIKELARTAGVSVATISRALNNKGPVSQPVRERILSLAAEMHYVPHGAARSLVTPRTSTFGVLLPDICGEFFSELIRGIDLTARRHGYHLLVSGSHGDRAEAVFAANDVTAIGMLCAFTEARVRVPEDIAVSGFDDIPIARYLTPPLTSVQVPIDILGARALERLLLAIDLKNHHERVREVLPATLMVRQSCGGRTGPTSPMRRATPRRRTL